MWEHVDPDRPRTGGAAATLAGWEEAGEREEGGRGRLLQVAKDHGKPVEVRVPQSRTQGDDYGSSAAHHAIDSWKGSF